MASLEKATFGAGCFWGVEDTFMCVIGVKNTMVGYSGGHAENPTYEEVCTDTTGHAESVEVEFDPSEVSYEELLNVFWESHNPTQLNRQGPDIGEQYRSVIFYHTPEQEKTARKSLEALEKSGKYKKPIVTQIEKTGPFNKAEEYHQKYNQKHGRSSCKI